MDAGIREGFVTSMLWVRSVFMIGAEAKQRILVIGLSTLTYEKEGRLRGLEKMNR